MSADGAPYAAELVKKAMKGDGKPPVVVVLLDGDKSGQDHAPKVAEVIGDKQVCTLREIKYENRVFVVLEDIVPDQLINQAIHMYAARLGSICNVQYDGKIDGVNNAKKIEAFCRANLNGVDEYEDREIRSGVVDSLVDLISVAANNDDADEPLSVLKDRIGAICKKLNEMIEHAQRNVSQKSLRKLVRLRVETFLKRFPIGASKGDVRKTLQDIQHVVFGRGEDFERTLKNVELLLELLDSEARQNADVVILPNWRIRLERLKGEPWAKVQDWSKFVATSKSPAAALFEPSNAGTEQAESAEDDAAESGSANS